jgi:hypothetical protein
MATREEMFPSKHLKCADLEGKSVVVEIEKARTETLKALNGTADIKTVLYFKGGSKDLPLNRTNWDSCAAICGPDSDDWAGHKIELYPDKTTMGNKIVDCIRIRSPSKKSPSKSALPPKKPVLPPKKSVLPEEPPPEDPPEDREPIFGDDDYDEAAE